MESDNGNYCLLVVDDDPSLLSLLVEFLQENFDTEGCSSGDEALQRLEQKHFDLVISDINMPGMKGYELLSEVRRRSPGTKTALITAWSVEDVIRNVLEHNIGNIIAKTVPFDFQEFLTTIKKILSEDIFGLEKYFDPSVEVIRRKVCKTAEIQNIRDETVDFLADDKLNQEKKMVIRLILDESISNAAYHPYGLEKGSDINLSEDQAVQIEYAKDEEKVGISVSDPMGNLTQKDILSRLADCFHPTEETLLRESGRGLFLMHTMVDRMIINIKRGVRTEVIVLVYTSKMEAGHHPLLIHEI